jgi:hypothetical protein
MFYSGGARKKSTEFILSDTRRNQAGAPGC